MALQKYLLALALLLTGYFLNVNAQDKIKFSTTQSASIKSAQTKLLAVTALAEGMSTNSYTKPLVSSTNFDNKLSAARGKANEIETKLLGEDDAEGKAERISGALTGVSDGLVGMIGGIRDGDWVQGVQGALGQLKARIAEVCTKPDDTTKARRCLDFLQLYAEMSILRQLILADMASLLSEPEIDLLSTGNNLLHLIKKEQESDKAVIGPYADPLNNPEKREPIALLFGSPEKYSLLNAYMRTLHDVVDGDIFRGFVVVCDDVMLREFCSALEMKKYEKLSDVSLNDLIASMYIPRGKQVTAWVDTNFEGVPLGPFVGPVVHGLVPSSDKWSSMKIDDTEDSIEDQVRFCEKENMNPEGLCDSAKPSDDIIALTRRGEGNDFHGTNWGNKIKSLYVPAGLNISGFDNSGSSSVADKFGPYYGPQQVNKVCNKPGKPWNAIAVHVTKGETNAEGKEITPPKDARRMVQFCDGENLKGMCLRDDETRTSLTAVMKISRSLRLTFH